MERCRGFRCKKDAWRADFARPARATSVSRENNLQSSREQLAILARNGINSREKWMCFSRETKVFLARNGSVSHEKWIFLSEGGYFSIVVHAFAVWDGGKVGRGKGDSRVSNCDTVNVSGKVESWNSGMVEEWNGGRVEWWKSGIAIPPLLLCRLLPSLPANPPCGGSGRTRFVK